MKINQEQSETLLNAIIDLTQSDNAETARRARSALFDVGLITGNDGGVAESKALYANRASVDAEIQQVGMDRPSLDAYMTRTLRETTKRLLDKLNAAHAGTYPVDPAKGKAFYDPEIIWLGADSNHCLAIEELHQGAIVSLKEKKLRTFQPYEELKMWIVRDDCDFDAAVSYSLGLGPCEGSLPNSENI